MIVAITGARGFIGSRLARAHLDRGDEVRALTRRVERLQPNVAGCISFRGNLAVAGDIPAGFLDGTDVLYHCAAELRDVQAMEAANVRGTQNLLDTAVGRVRRWVQLSSVGVYGPCREGEVREDAPLHPSNAYERTKAAADLLLMKTAEAIGLEWTILRPTIVFGSEMPNSSIRQLAAMIRRGLYWHIGVPGASANYIHVENVVHALLLCGEHPDAVGRIFNLSDHRTFEDFICAIADDLNVPAPSKRLPETLARILAVIATWVPGSPLTLSRIDALTGRAQYPIDRIVDELGYRHIISMEDGLAETLSST